MKDSKIFYRLIEHVQNNIILYIISILFLCIGIVIGIYSVKYMDSSEKVNIVSYIASFPETISPAQVNQKNIFMEAFKSNGAFILAIWFLGLTMLGTPIILIIDLLKGFTLGFTSSIVINGLGTKGILMDLLVILPQNIIYIPCMIISSAIAIEFSLGLFNNNSISINKKNGNLINIAAYSTLFLFILFFMIIGFIYEGYISPKLLSFITYNGGKL